MRFSRWPDRLGMVIAIGCGIHCAAMTIAFLAWPALWLNRSLWERGVWQQLIVVEWTLLGLAWVLILSTSVLGWLGHGRWQPPVLGLAGISLMTASIVSPLHTLGYWGSGLALLGGVMVATAHWMNLRLACQRGRAPPRKRSGLHGPGA
ncbi:MerC domain-containing protein [Wenzhouxiangella sp. AB-CW3]|uniref:MerC domain-containing protein n=1 Tax=Wenzhouxiangella sp. AB-CW3 TaxID=2771012 RepID=UPI00168BF20E|nr:MerC domain-containing protein [Wenzhouxiangella sp. AB-CW3]QOC22615.1 MerC domain-containing protein [Wenzhouxiangella sp. AB-CW3]